MKFHWLPALAVALLGLVSHTASAQLFTSTLDDGTGWGVVADPDYEVTFGFDYSKFGIPAAPNGTGTTGLRMAANIVDPAAVAVVSTYPESLDVSGNYRVEVDMWLNFNSSGGTTEFGGASVGFDPAAAAALNGASLLVDTDGDTARDFRLYKDGAEQFIESGQYALPSQDGAHPDIAPLFPGQTTPAAQGDSSVFDPTNVIVTAADGTLAYAWHRLSIDVNEGAGTATFMIDDVTIGTIDNSVGTAVNLSGKVALGYADIFTSVSNKPEFSFGIFDNLVVTQVPEPSSLALLLCGLPLLARRRK